MGNPDHLAVLKLGSFAWNEWRHEHPDVIPDLRGAHFKEGRFSRANLSGADLALSYFGQGDLTGADLTDANLSEASLRRANFSRATLRGAKLVGADLTGADFFGAALNGTNLTGSYLERANLTQAVCDDAILANSDLRFATAAETSFRNADLTGCQVYGISVWNAALHGAHQRDLVITPPDENPVTTDNLQIAQFLFLLLNNRSVRDVIETVGKKAVLILGRFTDARKAILQRIRDELRSAGFVPILFDFAGPSNRDITETVSTLAHLSRAVIVDITDAKSVPQELMAIVPNLPSVPVLPIIDSNHTAYGMFEHFQRYPWVHQPFRYTDSDAVCRWIADEFRRAAFVGD